ncbi:MAG: hypothetical protein KKE86_05480 [Planctomycetes bacterium]|nr:hypothetical protein [Planctomycetota bacterium]MBU4398772.1 hypothetical protein [Planctomycetota bacterium]
MNRTFLPVRLFSSVLLGIVAAAAGSTEGRAEGKPIPPFFAEIRQTVLGYFKDQPNYRPGDLITRKKVEPLLVRLQEMGLPLPEKKEILDAVPVEGEFLAGQLSTPAGWKFMRQISRYPDAYDRLDRLSRLPRGRQTVRDLIRGPDGYKMIEYMTTAAGGKELGKMLSNSPNGKKFNAPTGRVYTAEILLERLEQSRAASVKAARKQPGR